MSEPKLISPMLDNFSMGEPISNRYGVRCCPAMRENSDSKYIVKMISIPASQVQLQALLLTGAYQTETAARDYFLQLAEGVIAETDILTRLAKLEGFLPYEDRQIVPMEQEVGYDVYLLSPYKRSLARHMRKTNMTHLAAVNLGLDICASLAVCRQAGYLYVALKPENIFICNDREFRIGDIGFLKLDGLKYASLPERHISPYTAPEVVDAFSDVNPTIDVYAAGMVLYKVYNGGTLPFEDRAPAEALPPPAYADYEMAEIILKACAPDPNDRWEDPVAMGQALVAYMQRNSVNDTPIVTAMEDHAEPEPAPAAVEEAEVAVEAGTDASDPTLEEPDEVESQPDAEQIFLDEFYELIGDDSAEAPQEDMSEPAEDEFEETPESEEAEDTEEEDLLNLSFLDAMDDTHPSEEMADSFSYDELGSDANDILAQADDLISHEAPAGVVAPEPIEVPVPEPIVLEPNADQTEIFQPPAELSEEDYENDDFDELYEDEEFDEEEDSTTTDWKKAARMRSARKREARRKVAKRWLTLVLILAVLAGLAYGGWRFYKDYYLRSVTDLSLSGSEDALIVTVKADVDESLLTVYCIDTYGTSQSSPVQDGKAIFTGLNPNTLYRVEVEVTGMRKLTGEISDSYTTPVQTNIISFSAVTGAEAGSAILSFTVDGMDSETWTVTYSAEDAEEQKAIFSGHMVTVNGLIPGKTYTFVLNSGTELYLTGNDRLEYTAMVPVFAENLAITGCTETTLDVSWDTPADAVVGNWTVRCYSDSGYDQTVTTTDTAVTFTGLNGNEAHTVEVTAEGMSSGNRCYMTANAVTVTNVTATTLDGMNMQLAWDFNGNKPEGQWLLTYRVDGADYQEMVRTETNSTTVTPLIPGAVYEVSLLLEDGTTVFTEPFRVTAPSAPTFDSYMLNVDNIEVRMCRTPDKDRWSHADLDNDDYTDTFASGSKASFLLHAGRTYMVSEDIITIMYVIRNEDGKLISNNTKQFTWSSLWYKRYCELDVPQIPDVAGTYSIEIYFSGAFLHSQQFHVTEN